MPIAVKAGTNTSLLILREIAEIAYRELRDLMDGKRLFEFGTNIAIE